MRLESRVVAEAAGSAAWSSAGSTASGVSAEVAASGGENWIDDREMEATFAEHPRFGRKDEAEARLAKGTVLDGDWSRPPQGGGGVGGVGGAGGVGAGGVGGVGKDSSGRVEKPPDR